MGTGGRRDMAGFGDPALQKGNSEILRFAQNDKMTANDNPVARMQAPARVHRRCHPEPSRAPKATASAKDHGVRCCW